MISDNHERRLGEAAEELAELAGTPAAAVPATSPSEDDVQALFDDADRRARPHRRARSTTPASAAPRRLVDMTDEQWSLVLDVTLNGTFRCHARRAAAT